MRWIGTALMVVGVSGSAVISPVHAAPPTVVPSPGYDARLAEQRAQIAHESFERNPQPSMRHRSKWHHSAAR